MNTPTEGIAQFGPLMPGNVFTTADSVYAALQRSVQDRGNNKNQLVAARNLSRDDVGERNGAEREGEREGGRWGLRYVLQTSRGDGREFRGLDWMLFGKHNRGLEAYTNQELWSVQCFVYGCKSQMQALTAAYSRRPCDPLVVTDRQTQFRRGHQSTQNTSHSHCGQKCDALKGKTHNPSSVPSKSSLKLSGYLFILLL